MTSPIEAPQSPPPPESRPTPLSGLARLGQLERSLEQDWADLQARGMGFAALHERLAKQPEADDALRRWLAEAARVQTAFLARLDAFALYQHGHFVEQVSAELEHAVATLQHFYGPGRKRAVLRRHRRLQKLAARYRDLEPLYGSPKDHQRIEVLQRLARLRRALARAVRHLPPAARLARAAIAILWTLLRKPSKRPGTPFTKNVDRVFRALGELLEVRVRVEGSEHKSAPPDESCVTLFTPAHRHGFTDNVTFSHLDLPDYCVFNAVDQLPIVPRFLKERIAATKGLIAVGGGRGSSVERALDAIVHGVSRNVLIYPEGSVSEGFGGTRPPRKNFGEGLVRRIRGAGYPLELVAVTYKDNARFLDLESRAGRDRTRALRVVVSPRLDTKMVDALLDAGGGAMVGNVLRLAWLENLETDELRFLGLERAAAVERRLDLELDGIRYWGSLEPVPVSDRLHFSGGGEVQVSEEPFRGKRVRVFEIPASARDERERIEVEELRRFDSSELLIGIRPPSHIYLSVGRSRFDGDIFRPLRVKERDVVYPGIVIRFTGIPVKSLNAVRRKLEALGGREQRTLTCANSACRVIARSAEIRIDDHSDLRPFLPSHLLPTRTIRKIIERGVRDHAGNPIAAQIYKTDPRPLEVTLAEMRRAEIRIARDHLKIATVGALRALARGVARILRRGSSV